MTESKVDLNDALRVAGRLRNELDRADCRMPEGWNDAAAGWLRDAQQVYDYLAALAACTPAKSEGR